MNLVTFKMIITIDGDVYVHFQRNWTSSRHTKNNFQKKTKGLLQQIRNHVQKNLDKKNPNLLCIFYVIHTYMLSFFKTTIQITLEQKYAQQNWILYIKYSCVEVSGPSEVLPAG